MPQLIEDINLLQICVILSSFIGFRKCVRRPDAFPKADERRQNHRDLQRFIRRVTCRFTSEEISLVRLAAGSLSRRWVSRWRLDWWRPSGEVVARPAMMPMRRHTSAVAAVATHVNTLHIESSRAVGRQRDLLLYCLIEEDPRAPWLVM